MQARHDFGGVRDRADEVEGHVGHGRTRGGLLGDELQVSCWRLAALQPAPDLLRASHGRGEPHPLDWPTGDTAQAFEHTEQAPTTIRASEGVQLVDDDGPDVRKEAVVVDPP